MRSTVRISVSADYRIKDIQRVCLDFHPKFDGHSIKLEAFASVVHRPLQPAQRSCCDALSDLCIENRSSKLVCEC